MSTYGPYNPQLEVNHGRERGFHGRRQNRDRTRGTRGGKGLCDFFIFIDIAAVIAFVVTGLASNTWLTYTAASDGSTATTNSSVALFYFSRVRGMFAICPASTQAAVNSWGCQNLNLGQQSNAQNIVDPGFWNIVAMRRTEIALFIIVVVLTGFAAIIHISCLVPSCQRDVKNAMWKMGLASGILTGMAGALQLAGMIIFQGNMYYEATYIGTNCLDCYGYWPQTIQETTIITYGPAYALGWCAAGLLIYACIAYLTRDLCLTNGCRPISDEDEDEDMRNLETVSSVSYGQKGAARDLQFGQIGVTGPQQTGAGPFGANRLARYDIRPTTPQSYPNPSYVSGGELY